MALPLISVIVPIYKVENYLKECVDSILNQLYKNLEIILVDDGSPDSCPEMCDAFALMDERIKVIHKPNGGLSDARNAGLDIAKGAYVAFVDSDDVLHPEFLVLLYKALVNYNADVSFCDFISFSNEYCFNQFETNDLQLFKGYQMLEVLFEDRWIPKNVVVWNKLYKKELFENVRFPKGKIHEDQYIYTDLFACERTVVYLGIPLVGYRSRDGSITSNRFGKFNYECHLEFQQKRYSLFLKNEKFNYLLPFLKKEERMMNFNFFLNSDLKETRLNLLDYLMILIDSKIHWKSKIIFFKKIIGLK